MQRCLPDKIRAKSRYTAKRSAAGIAFTEFVDSASRIHHLLLTREKGVAGRAHFHMQILAQCGSGSELVSATADHFYVAVFGVDLRFHVRLCQKLCFRRRSKAGGKPSNPNRFY